MALNISPLRWNGEPGPVEHAPDVSRHVGDGITVERLVAESGAAIVQRDDGKALRQLLDEGSRPRGRVEPISHDQDERRSFAAEAIGDVDSICADQS